MTAQPPLLSRKAPPPKAGIVHLGLGAFFRAFGAAMVEEAMATSGGNWGICGVSLRSPEVRDRLAAQGNVYTAGELSTDGQKTRIITSVSDVIFAPENPGALLDRLADPAVKIASLTVTEKGYCHIPSTGELDTRHPDIQHDIANPTPRSAVGFLVRALDARRKAGHRPFSVLSCDNLPNNGLVVRNAVLGLAAEIDPALARWIASEGRFPATMVDRIVPAVTEDDITQLMHRTGYLDRAAVFHEPFRQWVIEDDFVDGARLDFTHVPGVQMVADVAPFEHMKVRMLNGTHSALAYLGYLAGHQTIAETVSDPVFRSYAQNLWKREIIPTLAPPEGVDLNHYASELLGRYDNAAVRHRTWQIAMDGSQKLPQRLLGTIADNTAAGRPCDGLILAVAAWMRYVGGVDEQGDPIDVRDPLASQLRSLSDSRDTPRGKVDALLTLDQIFGAAPAERFRNTLAQSYESLVRLGAKQSCQNLQ
ncbi:MAG: mannitol dehydrogenase family protein [Rhodobacteraceae bacterium]|nr:mannitol dehydrogenase family protein [Paracoccaceae bacterium]